MRSSTQKRTAAKSEGELKRAALSSCFVLLEPPFTWIYRNLPTVGIDRTSIWVGCPQNPTTSATSTKDTFVGLSGFFVLWDLSPLQKQSKAKSKNKLWSSKFVDVAFNCVPS